MSIDLHIHTTFSDGTKTPQEIVQLAIQKGLTAIAITDHDTLDGCSEAVEAGERSGLEIVPGVEISVRFQEKSLHLLGYFLDIENSRLISGLHTIQAGRKIRNEQILQKLQSRGIDISFEELARISETGEIGRPHIAVLLQQKGFVRSLDEAFQKYIGNGACCYAARPEFSAQKAIDLIHCAGGLAFWAHPFSSLGDEASVSQFLKDLACIGIDGVEVYYPTQGEKIRTLLLQLAAELGLLVSGGSDYHGSIRKGSSLAGGKELMIPYSLLEQMQAVSQKRALTL
ncbi:MAG: phosphoesterase [Deltaproteobacteria bacterium]|nr:MAG: phosphoesterase [Deltaproteobacteria bacterium]